MQRKLKTPNPKHKPFLQRGVKQFWISADWPDLWEQFYMTLADSGTFKYRSVREFAKVVSNNDEQRAFLEWYLGPKAEKQEDDPGYARFKFVGGGHPQDWKKKRETHGWYTRDGLKQLARTITSKQNALEKMAEAGDQITLQSFQSSAILLERLDREFQGRFFIDSLNMAQNVARSRVYLGLRKQIIAQLSETQRLYALSHGYNYEDMEGFSHFIAASINLSVQNTEAKKTGTEKLLSSLVQMTLRKAAAHNLPLPAEMDEKILEAVAVKDKDIQ